jgi:hypothetical protein
MWINPLTYSVSLLNHALSLTDATPNATPDATPRALTSLVVTAAFGVALLLASGIMAARKSARSSA